MDIATNVALIGALFTFFAAILTALVSFFRERSEKEKWRRSLEFERVKWERTMELEREKWQKTIELEERRIRHEENKWILELNSQRELTLYKMRLRTYPDIFVALEQLSQYRVNEINENKARELAEKLNTWGYSDASLCMSPDTREAVFALRRKIGKYLQKEISAKDLTKGPRTDLIELMRRDLNHGSLWREFETLTGRNFAEIQKFIEKEES
ncbi:hypothetical protein [Leptolyngbya sp. FACHB-261]|uniref:hypothetical protein n=1 Tax=Leptolyngbya sp. FACHB-261 TaxID=2692806 RepID=UPI00168217EE|nr:hypothetical protein [Leptolyngbya sp. FACHB-261]MBD2101603.1 hypothetical protein [Leptolyngbya sp. FACHB-261]